MGRAVSGSLAMRDCFMRVSEHVVLRAAGHICIRARTHMSWPKAPGYDGSIQLASIQRSHQAGLTGSLRAHLGARVDV